MKSMLKVLVMLFGMTSIYAQFPDRVGMPGSDAIPAEQLGLKWGVSCQIMPGLLSIANQNGEKLGIDDVNNAIGFADQNVISLGDGGMAILMFARPIVDGPGPDFAVFENSFEDYFLELAFVEVSSDGVHFVRFPATSLTSSAKQIGPFDRIPDVRKLNNLAGKYRGGYGTPFDLSELKDSAGIDIQSITHIRVIDVIGSIDPRFASYDVNGNIINDPWPTPFPTCGFDLDAIAVINEKVQSEGKIEVAPNPVHASADGLAKVIVGLKECDLYTIEGVWMSKVENGIIPIEGLSAGLYMLKGITQGNVHTGTVMILR
jgi:hypothetical protein